MASPSSADADNNKWLDFCSHDHGVHEHSAENEIILDIVPNGIDHAIVVSPEDDDRHEEEECFQINNDAELPFVCEDFNATCRLAARLGAAAMNNGSIADNIERFLPSLMEVYGFSGVFSCSTFQISCSFEKDDPEDYRVRTQNVAVDAGNFQLTRLGLLSDLAKDLMERNIGIQEANRRLDETIASPDPWGKDALAIAFVMIGVCLPALLSGTWWDVYVGAISGAMAYGLILLFDYWPNRVHVWVFLTSTFLCSILGSVAQIWRPEVDPTIVTLAGVGFLLPSTSITLGINDLVTFHVISGIERLMKGAMVMLWMALGYVLGVSLVGFLADDKLTITAPAHDEIGPIPFLWKLFLLPCLCCSLTVIFQMTGSDMMGAILIMIMSYLASYASVLLLDEPYFGSLIGSLAISLYANAWSRYFDRPNTVILFPAFQLVVAGIVGFMGLTDIIQGSAQEGGDQVLHMLIVAAIVVVGFLIGGAIVQPCTTI